MTVDQAFSQAMSWIHRLIGLAILALIAAMLLRYFGVALPIKAPGHIEMAYIAGAYWLAKGAKV